MPPAGLNHDGSRHELGGNKSQPENSLSEEPLPMSELNKDIMDEPGHPDSKAVNGGTPEIPREPPSPHIVKMGKKEVAVVMSALCVRFHTASPWRTTVLTYSLYNTAGPVSGSLRYGTLVSLNF